MTWKLSDLVGDYEEGSLMSGDTRELPIRPKAL